MPKRNQKSNHETQSSSEVSDDSVGDILSSVDQFIENVYRNLDLTPSHDTSSRNSSGHFRTRRSPNASISPERSPAGAASLSFSSPDDNENVVSPSRRLNIDAEVERINLMCARVERNLRSIGVFMNNSDNRSSSEDRLSTSLLSSPTSSITSVSVLNVDSSTPSIHHNRARETTAIEMPRPIIDLSESRTDTPLRLGSRNNNNNNNDEDEDDDVILVSSNLQPIVDLCTPQNQQETSRRRRRHTVNHTTLNSRLLTIPGSDIDDSCIEDGPSAARKRRMGNKRKSLDVSTTGGSMENGSPAVNISSDRSPYTCAVCLESYIQRQPTTTHCGHVFCLACITEAIRLTHKCPMCNARVGRNQIHRLYL